MRVLMAPDKFKGTMSAAVAAHAMAAGWRRSRPGDDVVEVPMADGGEGTLEALLAALGGDRRGLTVRGPLGDPVRAAYGVAHGAAGVTAIVEMALASGLQLVSESRRHPLRATTWGTGEVIGAAAAEEPAEILVCIGGSATVDGGGGMAQALGVRLLDAEGRDIGPGGAGLLELERIDASTMDPKVRRTRVVVATDVDNPLTGPEGAAVVYGPQKGATPQDVLLLDRALRHLAAVVHRDLGLDLRDVPGAGAAGGLGAGLVAFLGAHLRPGVEVVIDAVGLRDQLRRADLAVTGEGALDEQSLRGKVPAGVIEAARAAGIPVVVACGRASVRPDGVEVFDLVRRFGEERAVRDARGALEELLAEVALEASRRTSGR
jgi:glycerate 2-kinase